jgi:hypothetical protein
LSQDSDIQWIEIGSDDRRQSHQGVDNAAATLVLKSTAQEDIRFCSENTVHWFVDFRMKKRCTLISEGIGICVKGKIGRKLSMCEQSSAEEQVRLANPSQIPRAPIGKKRSHTRGHRYNENER